MSLHFQSLFVWEELITATEPMSHGRGSRYVRVPRSIETDNTKIF